MDRDSNIGQEGIESIRIKGRRIDDLPLGQGNEAVAGLGEARETARMNAINTINAKYPKHRIDYLKSRINECNENIKRVGDTRVEQESMISEYTGLITMCKHRDGEIVKLDDLCKCGKITGDEFKIRRKEMLKQFPPYDVAAMLKQIVQCKEAIKRCEDVINKEHNSISEFSEMQALCRQRDKELAEYGAIAEGS